MANSSKELRQGQHNQLLELVQQAPITGLVLSADAVDAWIGGHSGRARYDQLGILLRGELRGRANASRNQDVINLVGKESIEWGHRILCRFLFFGPLAYRAFPEKTGELSPLAELGDIMRRSMRVLDDFAGTDIRTNTTWELNAGLLEFKPLLEPLPFEILLNDDGLAEFALSALTKSNTLAEVDARRQSGDLERRPGYESCPALGEVLQAQWRRAVDLCEQAPSLFAQDLAA